MRVAVPLNSRCSRKWLTPLSSAGSSREPTPTQTPAATDSAPGTRSVATVRPESSWVIRRSVNELSCDQRWRRGRHGCGHRRDRRDAGRDRVAATIGGAAAGLAAGTEVAELAGQLGIERIVEADSDRTVTGRCRLCRAGGGGAGASARPEPTRSRRHRWRTGSTTAPGSG